MREERETGERGVKREKGVSERGGRGMEIEREGESNKSEREQERNRYERGGEKE